MKIFDISPFFDVAVIYQRHSMFHLIQWVHLHALIRLDLVVPALIYSLRTLIPATNFNVTFLLHWLC